MNNDLAQFSTAVLFKEIAERKAAARKEALEKREMIGKIMVEHIDHFLLLQPKHAFDACSDSDVINGAGTHTNGGYNCLRCFLLEVKEDQKWEIDYVPELLVRYLPLDKPRITSRPIDDR